MIMGGRVNWRQAFLSKKNAACMAPLALQPSRTVLKLLIGYTQGFKHRVQVSCSMVGMYVRGFTLEHRIA